MPNDDIRKKLWNVELLVDDIKKFPQTYKTILKDLCDDGTCQTILRRKLNKLFKEGVVCKSSIPGTRFGQALLYTVPKEYSILVEASRIGGCKVFCFFKYEKLSRFYIEIEKCWELKNDRWKEIGNRKFFEGNILKWL